MTTCRAWPSDTARHAEITGFSRPPVPNPDPQSDASMCSSALTSAAGVSPRVAMPSMSGAVRPAAHMLARLKEAQKLGSNRALLPAAGELDVALLKLDVMRLSHISGLAAALGLRSTN